MDAPAKTVLVTGGAGFIGFHLISSLVNSKKDRIISIDNYFTGSEANHVEGAIYIKAHTKDVGLVINERIDEIYHLGEYSRVAPSMHEPSLVWDLNILGTLGVVDLWRAQGCKLIYAGSSTKFSHALFDSIQAKNLCPYTWAKAANSDLVANYGQWYGLAFAIVYLHNVYGPRELTGRYGTLVGILRKQYLNNEPLQITSPGTQMRCFTHVEDAVRAIMIVSERGAIGEYEIGTQDAYSIAQVAELFERPIVMLPRSKTARTTSTTNADKIKALGWKPQRTLRGYIEGIKKKASNYERK